MAPPALGQASLTAPPPPPPPPPLGINAITGQGGQGVQSGGQQGEAGALPPIEPAEQMFTPAVAEVSAMCSGDGITVQLMFAKEFFGKIYSQNYAHEHDCVYYNTYSMDMVMFSIPNLKCGTKVQRNSANLVTKMENEVYVQYDKDTQTEHDRRFLFICELASSSIDAGNTNTNVDTNSISGGGGGGGSNTRFGSLTDRFTVTPAQTVIIEVRDCPQGDVITLVVRAARADSTVDQSTEAGYSIFVHSCFAKDGTGHQSVMLIDERGCTARPQVAGRMQRARTATGDALYYFRMSAFKFPGPNDVYFTCTVDVCHDCEFKEICPAPGSSNRVVRRLRSMPAYMDTGYGLPINGNAAARGSDVRELTLHDYVRITDELPQDTAAQEEQLRQWENSGSFFDKNELSYWSSLYSGGNNDQSGSPQRRRPMRAKPCAPTGLTIALASAIGLVPVPGPVMVRDCPLAVLFAAITAFLMVQLRATRRLAQSTNTLCSDKSHVASVQRHNQRQVGGGSTKPSSVGVKLPSLRAFQPPTP